MWRKFYPGFLAVLLVLFVVSSLALLSSKTREATIGCQAPCAYEKGVDGITHCICRPEESYCKTEEHCFYTEFDLPNGCVPTPCYKAGIACEGTKDVYITVDILRGKCHEWLWIGCGGCISPQAGR